MPSKPTTLVLALQTALEKRGVKTVHEHFDGFKHVDLFLPEANIYIEVDGIQHLTSPGQIIADFKREHFSDTERINTLHISNEVLGNPDHLKDISEAIADIVIERKKRVF